MSAEQLLLAFTDTPVETALNLSNRKSGGPCNFTGGFLAEILFDIRLLFVFNGSFGDIKRFSPKRFLDRGSRFYTELRGDVIKEVIIVVVHC